MIQAYMKLGTVRAACEAVGISRRCHYEWLDKDPDYVLAFEDAVEDRADMLEEEAFRRGVEGVRKPVFWHGKLVTDEQGRPMGTRDYSDDLLLAQLKAAKPAKYRERWDVNLGRMSDDELLALARAKGISFRTGGAQGAIGSAAPSAGGNEPDPKPN